MENYPANCRLRNIGHPWCSRHLGGTIVAVMNAPKYIQYFCAVALIFTSIAMVAYQVIKIQDVANGLLFYVAQAFLLAGSIFGLSYYVDRLTNLGKR